MVSGPQLLLALPGRELFNLFPDDAGALGSAPVATSLHDNGADAMGRGECMGTLSTLIILYPYRPKSVPM